MTQPYRYSQNQISFLQLVKYGIAVPLFWSDIINLNEITQSKFNELINMMNK